MAQDTTNNANNGVADQAIQPLISPEFAAYSKTGYGEVQRYFGGRLQDLETKAKTYKAENARIDAEIKANLDIMTAEAVNDRVLDESGYVYHSAAYDAASEQVKALKTQQEELREPTPLPSVKMINSLHKLAIDADANFAVRHSYVYQLQHWDELNSQSKAMHFQILAEAHTKEFIDNAEQERLGRLMAEEMKHAEKCYSGVVKETPLEQEKYHLSDLLGQPKANKIADSKPVYDDDALYILGYKPLTMDSPELKTYICQVAQRETDSINQDVHKVRYNMDLARGVYPQMNLSETWLENGFENMKWGRIEGAGIGAVSMLAGNSALKGVLSGSGYVVGKFGQTAAGELISGAADAVATKLPTAVTKGASKVGGFVGTMGLGMATQLPIDEALRPITVRDKNGAELKVQGIEVEPLSKAEEKEMNKKILFKDDIPLLSPMARALTFSENALLSMPELTLQGQVIPSRCVNHADLMAGLDYKQGGSDIAQEVHNRIATVGNALDNYNERSKKYFEIRDELREARADKKENSVTQPLAATEIKHNNVNGVVKNDKTVNELGGR